MRYVSTRGSAPALDFADVLVGGLAPDGGLYVPEWWPTLDQVVTDPERPYADVAVDVMYPFVDGSVDPSEFEATVKEAYATFSHPEVTPIVQLDDGLFLQELFWGPTLAFKDVALQLVGRLMSAELERRDREMTVLVATSGDTGSAAIDACRDRPGLRIVVLHPAGRISEVQRRQMTTVTSPNVCNLAIEGTFDDCQDLVKAMFADHGYRSRHHLGAMNSINWARVMAQIVYYVVGASRAGGGRPVSFAVPTGNFGNIFAGWCARRMGLPVRRLILGTNSNDGLADFFSTGRLEVRPAVATLSPAMDVAIASNLERLLFELNGRNGPALSNLMTELREDGNVAFGPVLVGALSEMFDTATIDDGATLRVIALTYAWHDLLVDPHSAVGLGAAAARAKPSDDHPVICLATAHPAKFADAVTRATGVTPELPPPWDDLLERPERFETVPNDLRAVMAAVADFSR